MLLYPLLYCSYIVISGSELLLHCYARYCTAPTKVYYVLYRSYMLYPVLCCSYIVISGNILLLHRYIQYCTAPTSHVPPLRHCIISLFFYTYFVTCRPILLFRSRQISYSTVLITVKTSLITRGEGKKSTLGISSKVRRRGRLFEPVFNTHTPLSTTLTPVLFICPSSTQ